MPAPSTSNLWHVALFLAVFGGSACVRAAAGWPWVLLLPLGIYAVVVAALPALRRTAPRIRVGRRGGLPLVLAVMITGTTSAVLVGYHMAVRPDVSRLAAMLPVAELGNLLLAGACFSLLNAVMEEVLFRGLVWDLVARESNDAVALLATSVLFGWGHLQGYPPGPAGAVMAGLYGLALGQLRRSAGGLGLPIACHVGADATIFALMWWSGAFTSALG